MSILNVSITDPKKGSLSHFTFNETKHIYNFDYPCSNRNDCTSYEVLFKSGVYKFECWGASGGDGSEPGGHGAYVTGTILFIANKKLYFYIGGKGESDDKNTFNGGGSAKSEYGTQGGGATDVRIVNNQLFEGLKSRIIVAAGGGGATRHDTPTTSGNGGTIIGTIGYDNINSNKCLNPPRDVLKTQIPANQTHGGISDDGKEGEFGIGGSFGGGGGGGGYYGGSPGIDANCIVSTGGGGSSFISGHEGCKSIERSSTPNPIKHTSHSFHYSGLFFKNTLMQGGDENFLSPQNSIETGHSGNGFIRITVLMNSFPLSCECYLLSLKQIIFITIFVMMSI